MSSTSATRGFWPMRDLPVVFWLVATGVVSLVHPFVPAPRWLMIHLLLLGAATHSILVWSRYFANALLRTKGSDRTEQNRRLVLLNLGAVGVVVGVPSNLWILTLVAATAVGIAVLWHGWAILRLMREALPSRFRPLVRYYLAAACFLPIGAGLGATLARGPADPLHIRLVVAHATVNLLGWIGLTVVGTLVTLWPTMLRTRMADGSEAAAARALPVLICSVLVAASAAACGVRTLTALGVCGYVAGLLTLGRPFLDALRRKPPAEFPAWSVLAGIGWLLGCLLVLAIGIARAGSWQEVDEVFRWITPFLAAGFAAQVLLGALGHLIPVALGGGPSPARAAGAVIDRAGPVRLVVTNAGLLVCALPVVSVVRVLASMLVLAALAATVPLLQLAIRASRRARRAPAATGEPVPPARSPAVLGDGSAERAPAYPPRRPAGQATGLAAVGVAIVAITVAAGVALDSAALGGPAASASAGVTATGRTTTVQVAMKGMRFVPAVITVPAGDRLLIQVTNADDDTVHDLVLETGARSGRLAPGGTSTVDVGTVGRDLDGWCSVIGHRRMGMVLTVRAAGGVAAADPADQAGGGPPTTGRRHDDHAATPTVTASQAPVPGPEATPAAGWTARDARLPAVPSGRVHRRTLVVRDELREVAPGITQTLWTYDGTAPGPALHGRVGDRFEITLVNRGTIGHSIDFHAGALAPQGPMRTIPPGASLTYRFRATRAGVWMYHCSTMPMSAHIANGLFGAVVIDPPELPPVDRTYLLVQSELYLGRNGEEVDAEAVAAGEPDLVVFNGYANQYDRAPLQARTGERVRIWVLDAGPDRSTSFHVVGAQFDTVYAEGTYLLGGGPGAAALSGGGAQSLGLEAAQGGFVELTFLEPGDYPFVSHRMIDAERGAHGVVRVLP